MTEHISPSSALSALSALPRSEDLDSFLRTLAVQLRAVMREEFSPRAEIVEEPREASLGKVRAQPSQSIEDWLAEHFMDDGVENWTPPRDASGRFRMETIATARRLLRDLSKYDIHAKGCFLHVTETGTLERDMFNEVLVYVLHNSAKIRQLLGCCVSHVIQAAIKEAVMSVECELTKLKG